MALYKKIASQSGFNVNYWKLTGIEIDNSQKVARLTITPYVSKAARQKGMPPVQGETKKYVVRDYDYDGTEYAERSMLDYTDHFSPAALEAAGLDIYKVAYGYIKGLPEFEGAEDA